MLDGLLFKLRNSEREDMYKNIIFMKYGKHAKEEKESIIERKLNEINNADIMFWGYGGTICHPQTQVQKFVKNNLQNGEKTYLLLSETSSEPDNGDEDAIEYSFDKVNWLNMPSGICVKGSRYALICGNLEECLFKIDLSNYVVGIGPSKEKRLSNYIKNRVDKSCGVLSIEKNTNENSSQEITYIAEVVSAVFLKYEKRTD